MLNTHLQVALKQGPAAFWVQVRWPPLKVFSFIFETIEGRSSLFWDQWFQRDSK